MGSQEEYFGTAQDFYGMFQGEPKVGKGMDLGGLGRKKFGKIEGQGAGSM